MVQADDWLFPDCIRSMVEIAEAHPAIGIVAAYELAGESVNLDGLPYSSSEVSGRDACRFYLLKGKYLFGSPTSSLIRSEVIRSRNPFYDERYAPFEDAHVCFDLLKTWNFGFVHQVLTYSRRDNESILSRMRWFGLPTFSRFAILIEHGKYYLSTKEYNRCLKHLEREYFVYLTKAACARRPAPREFWEFHRRGLASINYRVDWKRLARWLPRAVVEKAWEAFWRRWDGDSRSNQDSGHPFQQPGIAG
jgi:hypothetical protein